jgi:hypothetical protein
MCRNGQWELENVVTDVVSLIKYLVRQKTGTDCNEWFIQYPGLQYDLTYLKREGFIYILKNTEGLDRAFVNSLMFKHL